MSWFQHRHALGTFLLTSVVACSSPNSGPAAEPESLGNGVADPQIPPQNAADLATWLSSGLNEQWAHESAVHAARSPSPHEPNQIFENDLMVASTTPNDLPIGSAAVKLLFADDQVTVIGHSVQVKVHAGSSAASWYWYQSGGSLSGDGVGATQCSGCHSGAADFVFTRVTQ